MTDMINDDEDFQQFEASGSNTVTDTGNYPENDEWNSGDGMNSNNDITNDGITNPEVLGNSEILDGFNTNNNANWGDMTTDTNKLNGLTTNSLSELVSGATKNIENADSSSCEGGWFKCLMDSIDLEQMDQMTILVILVSVCVLIFVIVLFVCKNPYKRGKEEEEYY
jgi:hypothetical protein